MPGELWLAVGGLSGLLMLVVILDVLWGALQSFLMGPDGGVGDEHMD